MAVMGCERNPTLPISTNSTAHGGPGTRSNALRISGLTEPVAAAFAADCFGASGT